MFVLREFGDELFSEHLIYETLVLSLAVGDVNCGDVGEVPVDFFCGLGWGGSEGEEEACFDEYCARFSEDAHGVIMALFSAGRNLHFTKISRTFSQPLKSMVRTLKPEQTSQISKFLSYDFNHLPSHSSFLLCCPIYRTICL